MATTTRDRSLEVAPKATAKVDNACYEAELSRRIAENLNPRHTRIFGTGPGTTARASSTSTIPDVVPARSKKKS